MHPYLRASEANSSISNDLNAGRKSDAPRINNLEVDADDSSRDHTSPRLSSLWNACKLDLLLCFVSLAAMGALGALLWYEDGKAQSEWKHGYLTLNALVSTLATIARTALIVPVATAISQDKWSWFYDSPQRRSTLGRPLSDFMVYDAASRGLYGSLKLLCSSTWKHMASLGATVTILSVLVDPFTQQVLSTGYRSVPIPTSSGASPAPGTFRYDGLIANPSGNDGQMNASIATRAMRAAIISGLLSPPVTDLTVTCATGNCTWPIQASLAVCGECTKYEPRVTTQCTETDTNYDDNSTYCAIYQNYFDGRLVDQSDTATTASLPISQSESTNYNDPSRPYLAVFRLLQVPASPEDEGFRPFTNATGSECALWFCVEAYNVSMQHGIQNQRTTSIWSEYINSTRMGSVVAEVSAGVMGMYAPGVGSGMTVTNWVLQPDHATFNLNALNQYFSISELAFKAVSAELDNVLSGNLTISDGLVDSTSDYMMAYYQQPNVSEVVAKLASSMTNYIRTTVPSSSLNTTIIDSNGTISAETINNTISQPNDSSFVGTAFASQAFFQVRWVWLILPALLVLLAPVALCSIMYVSWRDGVRLWGTAPLALMQCSVDDNIKRVLGAPQDNDKIEKRASKLKVKLQNDGYGATWSSE